MPSEIPPEQIRTKADHVAIEQGCYWSADHVAHFDNFTRRFFRSQYINGPLKLHPLQEQCLHAQVGWRLENGNRRFRFANFHVPKKSFGKTLLTSVMALYEFAGTDEPSPFLVSAAPAQENASQIWKELKFSLEQGPLHKFCKYRERDKKIELAKKNAQFQSLSNRAANQHGWNCSGVIVDEGHVTSEDLYFALRHAPVARPNGWCAVLSTAGDDPQHWYYQVLQKSRRILSGEDLDISHYALVYEMDQPKGDPFDPVQWKKANPLLGSPWCPLDQFKRDLEAARASGVGEWLNFLRLRLNFWCAPHELAWWTEEEVSWKEQEKDIEESTLRECEAAIGIDASQTTDPSSCSIVFKLPDGQYHIRSWCWVAEDSVRRRDATNLKSYKEFEHEGSLEFTPGNMIDEEKVREHVLNLCRTYNVKIVNLDPNSAIILGRQIEDQGYKVARVPQRERYFNPVMREFTKNWITKRITHPPHQEWLRYCLSNIRISMNKYGEISPVRKVCRDHIDGGIATLLGLHGILTETTQSVGIIW